MDRRNIHVFLRECDTDIYTTIKTGVAFINQDI